MANQTTTSRIEIETADGICSTGLFVPAGGGKRPAVIALTDAGGLRPAQARIAERIASWGYLVFQPDLFHRSPPIATLLGNDTDAPVGRIFGDPALRARFMTEYYAPALDYGNLERTIGALLDHIAGRTDVAGGVATTGYCMGGNASVRIATIFGARIAATAAFHPGGLVTDQPNSPHTRASRIRSRVYLAPAIGDLPPEAEAKLRAELDAGHVRYEIEHYDARHGYVVEDDERYDAAAAERHYAALERLLAATLRA